MSTFARLVRLSRYYGSFLNRDFLKAYLASPRKMVGEHRVHIDAAVQWLCRAQDAFPEDGGVARSYSLVYDPYRKKKGWVASYPETTGYIIPTLFDYARVYGNKAVYERSVRMAAWECDVQLENGAVQGGTIDQKPTPAVFNTGQVIFGWLQAFRETGQERYLEAARRAGTFLVRLQEKDGSWRRNLSDYTGGSDMNFYSYNTRTAWALLALSELDGRDGSYREAGRKNIEFALTQQYDNGWFKANCLNDQSQPLLHTIAYCIRGILESGMILADDFYIARAKLAAEALAGLLRADGSLAGRYNAHWEPSVSWSCLTGNAQIAIIWGKLHKITGERKYLDCMEKINRYLKGVQLLTVSNPDIYGGICGSFPVQGRYGQYEILNWAVKFFIDALLLEAALKNVPEMSGYSGPQS